jgi:RNA recognition motif-containing protein
VRLVVRDHSSLPRIPKLPGIESGAKPRDAIVVSQFKEKSKLNSKLYVGNLPFNATDDDLENAFGAHGPVTSARVITDRDTGRSRGFGFVEFENETDAQAAQEALDGQDLGGRALRVNEAQERQARR